MILYLLSERSSHKFVRIVEYAFLFICLLTGPFVLVIFPLYLVLLYLKQTPKDHIITTIITLGLIAQIIPLYFYLGEKDGPEVNFAAIPAEISVKIFWNSLFGIRGNGWIFKGSNVYAYDFWIYFGLLIWLVTTILILRSNMYF